MGGEEKIQEESFSKEEKHLYRYSHTYELYSFVDIKNPQFGRVDILKKNWYSLRIHEHDQCYFTSMFERSFRTNFYSYTFTYSDSPPKQESVRPSEDIFYVPITWQQEIYKNGCMVRMWPRIIKSICILLGMCRCDGRDNCSRRYIHSTTTNGCAQNLAATISRGSWRFYQYEKQIARGLSTAESDAGASRRGSEALERFGEIPRHTRQPPLIVPTASASVQSPPKQLKYNQIVSKIYVSKFGSIVCYLRTSGLPPIPDMKFMDKYEQVLSLTLSRLTSSIQMLLDDIVKETGYYDWNDNWHLEKKQESSSSSVTMLIPSPNEITKPKIGDVEVDELSDLSDVEVEERVQGNLLGNLFMINMNQNLLGYCLHQLVPQMKYMNVFCGMHARPPWRSEFSEPINDERGGTKIKVPFFLIILLDNTTKNQTCKCSAVACKSENTEWEGTMQKIQFMTFESDSTNRNGRSLFSNSDDVGLEVLKLLSSQKSLHLEQHIFQSQVGSRTNSRTHSNGILRTELSCFGEHLPLNEKQKEFHFRNMTDTVTCSGSDSELNGEVKKIERWAELIRLVDPIKMDLDFVAILGTYSRLQWLCDFTMFAGTCISKRFRTIFQTFTLFNVGPKFRFLRNSSFELAGPDRKHVFWSGRLWLDSVLALVGNREAAEGSRWTRGPTRCHLASGLSRGRESSRRSIARHCRIFEKRKITEETSEKKLRRYSEEDGQEREMKRRGQCRGGRGGGSSVEGAWRRRTEGTS
ncbi:unnamed protein product [Nesidiocoris tenuis]|uniref:Uncharacterized protein n=1 Tax=Nesidiocoris tenuis TaxID=355587 RepID=A0A6H5H253_9HEMI|nr:unnamed protein product [Nesidiocoris tenuis]